MKKIIVAFGGPSQANKEAILEALLKAHHFIYEKIVSVTTRSMKKNDIEGKTFYFVPNEKFQNMVYSAEIFEYTESNEILTGMCREYIDRIVQKNRIPVKNCTLDEMQALQKVFPNVLTIMITVSREELNLKLLKDCKNDQERWRELKEFDDAMASKNQFDYTIENKNLHAAIDEIHQIIMNECNS